MGGGSAQGSGTVRSGGNTVAFLLEVDLQCGNKLGFIVDHEDALHGPSSPSRGSM